MLEARFKVLLLGAAVLTGCGGAGTDGGAARRTADGSARQPSPPTATGEAAGGVTGVLPDPPSLASRRGRVDGVPVRLDLSEVRRNGATVRVVLRLTTRSGEEAQVSDTFDDGTTQSNTEPDTDSTAGVFTMDGLYLIDGRNRRKHLVARDRYNLCVCDGDLSDAFLSSEAPLALSATFGAPPPDVRALDVVVPRFGTFADVPLG